MHIWFDGEKHVAYVSAGYRDEHYGSVYNDLHFSWALRMIGASKDPENHCWAIPIDMVKDVRRIARCVLREDVIPNTKGMTVEVEGQQYTLAEDIIAECGPLRLYTIHAEAYDPTGHDWPTTVYWDSLWEYEMDDFAPDCPVEGVIVCND